MAEYDYWTCDKGHRHGVGGRNRARRGGDPCQMKHPTAKVPAADLMRTRERRELPAKVTDVVSGGLPGLGKRK